MLAPAATLRRRVISHVRIEALVPGKVTFGTT
jgi:hypothetical protein